MKNITPSLWFDDQAEEAMNFYISVFKNSRVLATRRFGDAGPRPKGMFMTGTFELNGREFMVLNGGPEFNFTEAISLYVSCESQAEVDDLWEKLSAGGEKGPCGWLKDKYGVSWQIVPIALEEMLDDKDAGKAQRVMAAMLKMSKLDIAGLQQAYEGR